MVGEDRAERDVIGVGAQRGFQLGVVMGGDAERQAGVADRLEVGVGEIFLAEMQMLGAGDDRRAPVVVDHELRRACPAVTASASVHDLQRLGIVELLGAQLNGADAERGEARHPGDAVDDGIEAIRIRHARTGSR